jgi:hypothetical protein
MKMADDIKLFKLAVKDTLINLLKANYRLENCRRMKDYLFFACQCAFTEKRLISSRFKAIYILYQDWAEQVEGIDDSHTQIGEF